MRHPIGFLSRLGCLIGALEWTRTTTPLGTAPQAAAYTIPPRGQLLFTTELRTLYYTDPYDLSTVWPCFFISTITRSIEVCRPRQWYNRHRLCLKCGYFCIVASRFQRPHRHFSKLYHS